MGSVNFCMCFIELISTTASMKMTFNKGMSHRCIVSRNNITRISYNVIMDMPCGKYRHWQYQAKDKHQSKYE